MPTIDDVRSFWDRMPLFSGESSYTLGTKEWFIEHEHIVETDCIPDKRVIEYIMGRWISNNDSVLDVGCGPGYWVRRFLRKGHSHVAACDLTMKAVELTLRSLTVFDLQTQGSIVQCNAEDMPFDDGSFNHVNCQGVIHHTPNTEQCINEFHRVLKPHGTLCFSVYYRNVFLRHPALLRSIKNTFGSLIGLKGRGRDHLISEASTAEDLVRRYDGADNPIGKAYTRREVLELLSFRGSRLFRPLSTQRYFFPARALPINIPATLHKLLSRYAGLMIIVKAQKI